MFASLRDRLRDPIMWTGVSQLLKTALATVIAWVLAAQVLNLEQAYLAPWAALLTVHATVFGTLRSGVRQAGASALGILVAFAAGQLFGLSAVSVGAVILVGLLVGSVAGLRDERTTTAATALIVLTNGYSHNGGVLGARLLDTGVGIAVGLLVNLLVWPPLRDRSAAGQIDAVVEAVGRLLSEIAARLCSECGSADVDGWIAKTNALDRAIDRAWSVLAQARESGRLNPRRATARRMRAAQGFDDILGRLGQAVAETRSMARTIGHARVPTSAWDPGFQERWRELLNQAGEAISTGDADAVASVRADLTTYAQEVAVGRLREGFWPVAGAVLVNLRNILDALDVVADAQPVEVPRPTLRPAPRHPPNRPIANGVAPQPEKQSTYGSRSLAFPSPHQIRASPSAPSRTGSGAPGAPQNRLVMTGTSPTRSRGAKRRDEESNHAAGEDGLWRLDEGIAVQSGSDAAIGTVAGGLFACYTRSLSANSPAITGGDASPIVPRQKSNWLERASAGRVKQSPGCFPTRGGTHVAPPSGHHQNRHGRVGNATLFRTAGLWLR